MGSGDTYTYADTNRWREVGRVDNNKVLEEIKASRNNNLPTYSKTSNVYFKKNVNGEIVQMRVYGEKNSRGVRVPVMDVDFGYVKGHKDKNGTVIPGGVAHIHDFSKDANGKYDRSKNARPMTFAEMGKYYRLLKKANPKLKVKLKFK